MTIRWDCGIYERLRMRMRCRARMLAPYDVDRRMHGPCDALVSLGRESAEADFVLL